MRSRGRSTTKIRAGFIGCRAAAAVLVLSAFAAPSYGAGVLLGSSGGYSFALSEMRYNESAWGYTTPRLSECYAFTLGVLFDGHIALKGQMLVQRYASVDHPASSPASPVVNSKDGFPYLGADLEYRFFDDLGRRWNPYIGVGIYGLIYLDFFGSGPPTYPRTTCFKAEAGTRIRLAGPLYLNPSVAYHSGYSGLSFEVGLDLVIPVGSARRHLPDPVQSPGRRGYSF
jgi:hypothetical protein